jgi:transcriptional regulator with XRE-family HTH domain
VTNKEINRIKVVLAEKKVKNKWLAEKLKKNPSSISQWCTNERQPSLETLLEVSILLDIDIRELLISTK